MECEIHVKRKRERDRERRGIGGFVGEEGGSVGEAKITVGEKVEGAFFCGGTRPWRVVRVVNESVCLVTS